MKLSNHAKRLFEVEIRNEDLGGVRPSTLGSAQDSLSQAPDDVVAEWTGTNLNGITQEMNELIKKYGNDELLQDLLDS